LNEVEHFFRTYKDLEGKRVEIIGWGKSEEASRIVIESCARYDVAYGSRMKGQAAKV
jgi:inorganic pyrophosphatase